MASKTVANKKVLSPRRVGNKVFIRTVTMYYVGVIAKVDMKAKEILLTEASWVAETGVRFSEALKSSFNDKAEIEPMPGTVSISTDVVVDICDWKHVLPTSPIPASGATS